MPKLTTLTFRNEETPAFLILLNRSLRGSPCPVARWALGVVGRSALLGLAAISSRSPLDIVRVIAGNSGVSRPDFEDIDKPPRDGGGGGGGGGAFNR